MPELSSDTRRRVAVLAAVAVLGACDRGAEPNATDTTRELREPPASTSATPVDDAPALVRDGDDFAVVVASVVSYLEWLSAHPVANALDAVFVPGSPGDRAMRPAVERYEAEGWRAVGEPGMVVSAHLQRRIAEDHVLVYAVVTSPAYDVVDGDGAVIEHHDAIENHAWVFDLVGGNGHWRVQDRTVVGPA